MATSSRPVSEDASVMGPMIPHRMGAGECRRPARGTLGLSMAPGHAPQSDAVTVERGGPRTDP
ncbi:hypothetical protein GCM10022245_75990 [Streptomyces mayteni]